jgi:hypothetical protein
VPRLQQIFAACVDLLIESVFNERSVEVPRMLWDVRCNDLI